MSHVTRVKAWKFWHEKNFSQKSANTAQFENIYVAQENQDKTGSHHC